MANAVATIATSLLRSLAWGGIVYGLLTMGVAFLLGEHRHAVAARRQLGRATESTGGTVAAAAVLVVAVVAIYRKVEAERSQSSIDPSGDDPQPAATITHDG